MRLLAPITALVAAVAFSACGAEDISPETVANAAKATEEAGGSRAEIDMRMEVNGQVIDLTGNGLMDNAGRRGYLKWELPEGQGEMEQVMDGYVMYMRMDQFEGELPDGKSWMKIDLAQASKEMGIDITQFGQTGNNPGDMLRYLRAVGDVEKEGSEEVRGVKTTHYSAVVDMREYPKLVPEDEREQAEKSIDALLEQLPDPEIPMEVWIGEEDKLIHRMRMAMDMEIQGQSTSMDMDYVLYDFGTRVAVKPPPEDDVADLTELAAEEARRQQQAQ